MALTPERAAHDLLQFFEGTEVPWNEDQLVRFFSRCKEDEYDLTAMYMLITQRSDNIIHDNPFDYLKEYQFIPAKLPKVIQKRYNIPCGGTQLNTAFKLARRQLHNEGISDHLDSEHPRVEVIFELNEFETVDVIIKIPT